MSKFSVHIPLEGKRDALLADFAGNGVKYLYDISDYVSEATVAADATEETVIAVAEKFARDFIAAQPDRDYEFSEVEGIYEYREAGEFLGWEAVIRTVSQEVFFHYAAQYAYEEDEFRPLMG